MSAVNVWNNILPLSLECFSGAGIGCGCNCLFGALGRVWIQAGSLLELTPALPGAGAEGFPHGGSRLRLFDHIKHSSKKPFLWAIQVCLF